MRMRRWRSGGVRTRRTKALNSQIGFAAASLPFQPSSSSECAPPEVPHEEVPGAESHCLKGIARGHIVDEGAIPVGDFNDYYAKHCTSWDELADVFFKGRISDEDKVQPIYYWEFADVEPIEPLYMLKGGRIVWVDIPNLNSEYITASSALTNPAVPPDNVRQQRPSWGRQAVDDDDDDAQGQGRARGRRRSAGSSAAARAAEEAQQQQPPGREGPDLAPPSQRSQSAPPGGAGGQVAGAAGAGAVGAGQEVEASAALASGVEANAAADNAAASGGSKAEEEPAD
eukprot:3352003-Pyramimonas_sp.AAC.1